MKSIRGEGSNPLLKAVVVALVGFAFTLTDLYAGTARNVILFIGDGMGTGQVKAAACFVGRVLNFEEFPYSSSMTTFPADFSITDSAAAGTAIATGRKVNNGVISMAIPGNGDELPTILEFFKTVGKRTGLVTTTYIADATPAAFGAHASNRSNAANISSDYLNQTRPNVLFGGRNTGISMASATAAGYTVITSRAELLALDAEKETFVSGQFGDGNFPYEYDGYGDHPHLSEMTQVALQILAQETNGFFVMIEGGRIDHSCHANDLVRCIYEVLEFERAVAVATNWAAGRTDTLVVVTADHETGGLVVQSCNDPGMLPSVRWLSTYHTAARVPVYAWGVNAQMVRSVSDNTDISAFLMKAAQEWPDGKVFGVRCNGGSAVIDWVTQSGRVYRVERSEDLADADWQPLAITTSDADWLSFTDSNAAQRCRSFYRLIVQP